jgi:hypothetical protein
VLTIAPPPPPQLATVPAWGIVAGCLLLGAALLLWGRVLHRSFLAVVGAVAGILAADALAATVGLPVVVVGLIAILVLAAVGAVAARIVWALAGGAVFGAGALTVLLSNMLGHVAATSRPSFQASAAESLRAWAVECGRYAAAGVTALWPEHRAAVLWTLCLGGGVPLVTLLLLPRLGKIFMTALLGSAGLVGGGLLAVSRVRTTVWPTRWSEYTLYAVVWVVLLVFSLVYQYCSDVAERHARKVAEAKAAAEADAQGGARRSASHGRRDNP